MARADTYEAAGIVLGATLLVPLPIIMLVGTLVGLAYPAWLPPALLVFGFLVGIAMVKEWIPVEYRDLWYLSVLGGILAVVGWTVLGIGWPAAEPALATAVWVLALTIAGGVSRLR